MPVWSEVALRTVSVGRRVSSCVSAAGACSAGAVTAAGAAGDVGDDLSSEQASNTIMAQAATAMVAVFHIFTRESSIDG